jgi:hypothetical protein
MLCFARRSRSGQLEIEVEEDGLGRRWNFYLTDSQARMGKALEPAFSAAHLGRSGRAPGNGAKYKK